MHTAFLLGKLERREKLKESGVDKMKTSQEILK
jgi:hypothetical protein